MSTSKSPEQELVERIQAMPAEFIECRGNSRHSFQTLHQMRDIEIATEGKREDWVQEDLICVRCEMQRHDFFRRFSRGGIIRLQKITEWTRYTPPPGYSLAGIHGVRDLAAPEIIYGEKYRRAVHDVARVPDYVPTDMADR